MMPNYSQSSASALSTCVDSIVDVFVSVIKNYDNKVIQGHRTTNEQKANLAAGKTTTLKSKHLLDPSEAADVSPYPIPTDWGSLEEALRGFAPHDRKKVIDIFKERAKFYHFAGYVQGQADLMDKPLRWGGDWDGDKDFADQNFDDLVHFETK